jgi:hypothetical protein
MGLTVGKKGLEIQAAIIMPPRRRLLTLDRLALHFLWVVYNILYIIKKIHSESMLEFPNVVVCWLSSTLL